LAKDAMPKTKAGAHSRDPLARNDGLYICCHSAV
jgi:hypothetical protein